jgi:cobyrinic acid a,c-diamide synthase
MAARLIVAGTHSGSGKTTVTLALLAALRRRGLVVQPFKVGPDFIDPGHHAAVSGRVSYNLDTWMQPESAVLSRFHRATAGADCAVIEGVMGLFDGRSHDDLRGSTADLARLLACPVVLVVDAAGMAASVAAVVKGFADFDPTVRVAGVLCNHVAGPRHYTYLEPAIRQYTGVVPLGWMPRRTEWEIPERHLGLVTREDLHAGNGGRWQELPAQLATALEETVDVDRLLALAAAAPDLPATGGMLSRPAESLPAVHASTGRESMARIAVARDAAFCFYYPDNLELLEAAGAEVVSFAPLHDATLPPNVDLVYLGGGYPEVHAERLAANRTMRDSLRHYHRQGGAIYAECGGLMYCCRELVDGSGQVWPMLDLLPARAVMLPRLAALGYVTWRGCGDTLLGPTGTELRGHEYHYSRLEPLGELRPLARLERPGQEPRPDGFVAGRLLAGYAHLHLASNPRAVEALLTPGEPS